MLGLLIIEPTGLPAWISNNMVLCRYENVHQGNVRVSYKNFILKPKGSTFLLEITTESRTQNFNSYVLNVTQEWIPHEANCITIQFQTIPGCIARNKYTLWNCYNMYHRQLSRKKWYQ